MGSGVCTWPAWRVAGWLPRATVMVVAFPLAAFTVAGCGAGADERVVRGADEVQVMTPEEVAAARAAIGAPAAVGPTVPGDSGVTAPVDTTDSDTDTDAGGSDTIPLNRDDRPPELKLFDAFGKFRTCIEDKGYVIEGNLQDPSNPAYQDPAYRDAVSTCAARTDIVNILAEVQATRADLTPTEVEARNEAFVELAECLEDKGWTVETRTSEIGLLEPAVFESADGTLNERDIDQCVSELNIGEG